LRLGREIDRRGEEDAVFEVRGKEVFAAGDTSDKAARVFGIAEIDMTQPLIHAGVLALSLFSVRDVLRQDKEV
jgi:hypothetical protein